MNILAFSGSNSSTSINQQLVIWVSQQLSKMNPQFNVTVVSLRDYEMPLFGVDLEKAITQPASSIEFRKLMDQHDAFIISSPEHNGSIPAVFKNFIDWQSRNPLKQDDFSTFSKKAMLLLSASPGARGGKTNLENLLKLMPFWGAEVRDHYSLPNFYDNFQAGQPIGDHQQNLLKIIANFSSSLHQ